MHMTRKPKWNKTKAQQENINKQTKKKKPTNQHTKKTFSSASLWKGKVVFPGFMSQVPKTIKRQENHNYTGVPLLCWVGTSLASKLWNPWHSKAPDVSFSIWYPLIPKTLDFSELMPEQPHVKVGKRHRLGLQATFELLTNNTGLKSFSLDTSSTKQQISLKRGLGGLCSQQAVSGP